MVKLGLHMPSDGCTPPAIDTANAGLDKVFLWMPAENSGDGHRWPGATHIVRLLNPVVGETGAAYVQRVRPWIADWYNSGLDVYFIIGNEPDLEGWDSMQWFSNYPVYVNAMYTFFPGCRLLTTPMSVDNTALTSADTIKLVQGAAVHTYWQENHPEDITNPGLGGNWKLIADRADGKAVYITEVNSAPPDGDRSRSWTNTGQIGLWLDTLDARVDGVCFFIAPDPNWKAFEVNPTDAQTIASHKPPAPPDPPRPPSPPGGSFAFGDLSINTWQAMVAAGSAPGETSPFLDAGVFAAAYRACSDRDMSMRLLAAWLRSENRMATDISGSLLWAHNGAGIKYVGQQRAHDGSKTIPKVLAPANEGFAPYCVFDTWADFFWTLAVNIQTVLPQAYARGDLASIASYYTTGDPNAGGGANKVLFYNQYNDPIKYPAGSGIVPVQAGVTLDMVLGRAMQLVGWSYTEEGTPEFGACEQFEEEVLQDLGFTRVRYYSAATHIDALLQNRVVINRDLPPPPGSVLLFDRRFDPMGHICFAGNYPYIVTTYPGKISVINGLAWYAANGYVGYYIPEGIVHGGNEDMLPSDGQMDWGEVEILWVSQGGIWNPQSGIFNDWLAKRRAGINYGIPVGPEVGFENGARVLQPFSTGFVAQWTAQDNRIVWLGSLPGPTQLAPPKLKARTKASTG